MFSIYTYAFSYLDVFIFLTFFLIFAYQLYYYLRYISIAIRNNKKEKKGKIEFQIQKKPVSVVISARDEYENLRKFLPDVLTQEYPEYEVIVVNDGNDEDTELLLSDLKKIYPHLRSTFVPDGAKNLSTKKLALTLGIKAAKYDWLIFTDADCVPESKQWITSIARNFMENTEFVLGYGAYFEEKSFLNRLITYDTLFIALQYLGFAKAGKPYMGVGRNMAYKKNVFYEQNGFASTLNLKSGDDDLIVNKSANKQNTRIETSNISITWSKPNQSYRAWRYQKERHLSVSSSYSAKSKNRLVVEPVSRFVFYASFIFLLVSSIISFNWLLLGIASSIFVLRYVMQLIIINKSSVYFGGRKYFFSILIFDIILPLIVAYILTFGRMGSRSRYINWK